MVTPGCGFKVSSPNTVPRPGVGAGGVTAHARHSAARAIQFGKLRRSCMPMRIGRSVVKLDRIYVRSAVLGVGDEAVAEGAHRHEMAWIRGIGLDQLAKPEHERVHHARTRLGMEVPDLLQDLAARD